MYSILILLSVYITIHYYIMNQCILAHLFRTSHSFFFLLFHFKFIICHSKFSTMPIRMVDDDNQQQEYVPSNDGGGGSRGGGGGGGLPGGSGCLTAFLPILLKLVFKKPLIGIPILLIGAFVLFKSGLLGGGGTSSSANQTSPCHRCRNERRSV